MGRPDALKVLLLIRRIEVEAARQNTAEAVDRQRHAARAARTIADALCHEAASAPPPAYADWIAVAGSRAAGQQAELRRTEANVIVAQQALGAVRLAEKIALDALREQHQRERRRRLAREQRLLDDL